MTDTDIFKKDLFRYYGGKESIRRRLLRPLDLKYLYYFRKASEKRGIFYPYYKWMVRRLSDKTHIQIPVGTQIGEGLFLGHIGRVIVNQDAVIGRNVNLGTGVTIGQENRGKRKGCPVIGNEVWIGTNAVVVGNITIGDDVLIAPLAYVNFDVPSHSIVVGNPGRIITVTDATGEYINRKV